MKKGFSTLGVVLITALMVFVFFASLIAYFEANPRPKLPRNTSILYDPPQE